MKRVIGEEIKPKIERRIRKIIQPDVGFPLFGNVWVFSCRFYKKVFSGFYVRAVIYPNFYIESIRILIGRVIRELVLGKV
jgi:hypothetical protein